MPSVATGALLANKTMRSLGVSGDGDTASIGMGQFIHLMRRNVPMIYIIEDNGVYGLTKGQFSATADLVSKLKTGVANDLPASIRARWRSSWARLVGRSFSGDKKQLSTLLKGRSGTGAPAAGCDLAVRDIQRPRGIDQELQVREGPRDAVGDVGFVPLLRRYRG